MSADEKLLYDIIHCVEPGISTTATKKMEACCHLYDIEIISGAHRNFQNAKRDLIKREMAEAGLPDPDHMAYGRMLSDDDLKKRKDNQEEYERRLEARFGKGLPTIKKPLQLGALPQAAAAFLRAHDSYTVKRRNRAQRSKS